MQKEKTTTKESQSSTTGVGSNFNADSIIIEAGGDATIQGSFLAKDMSLNGSNITIKAIDSWKESSYKSKTNTASVGFSTAGGVSVGGGYNRSSGNSTEIEYKNSKINATNLAINSKSDINIEGANLLAKNIVLNANDGAGDIKVKSMQNTITSSGKTKGANASISANLSGVSGFGGGYNKGSTSSNSATTKEQSTILGSDSVIITGNKLTNVGSVIANANMDESGKIINVGDNMIINAKTIENIDLVDTSYSQSKGFNASMSVGIKDGLNSNIAWNKKGSASFNIYNNSSSSKQTYYASMGAGTLNVETIIGEANRDLTTLKSEKEITINRQLDATFELNLLALTQEGQSEVAKGSPKTLYYERTQMLDENGDPIHVTLLPNLGSWMGEEETGIKDSKHIVTGDKGWLMQGINWFFPGAHSNSLVHDYEMERDGIKDTGQLMSTIPASFIKSWSAGLYGTFVNNPFSYYRNNQINKAINNNINIDVNKYFSTP